MAEQKSNRERIRESPREYEVLVKLLALPHSPKIRVVVSAMTSLLLDLKPGADLDEVFDLIKKSTLLRIAAVRSIPKDHPQEICVVCEDTYPSDGSNEVPICPDCLVGVQRPEVSR